MAKKQKKKGKASDEATEAEEPQIDDAQTRQSIIDALEERRKGPTGPCVICGDNNWSVGLFSPISVSHEAEPMSVLSERIYSMATIVCRNCGNTHFINLNILGYGAEEDRAGLKFNKPEEPDA